MASVNFKQGIRKLLSQMDPAFVLSNEGLALFNRMLQDVISKLINNCLDTPADRMEVTTARNAVGVIFHEDLKNLAFAEANRQIALYSNGLLEYKPKRSAKRKKGKKARAIAALELSQGISDLKSRVFPEASLEEQPKQMLCEMLEELAVKISDFVQLKNRGTITVGDIRRAVESILPDELSRHAIAEGARMTSLFGSGILKESVRRPAAVRKRKRSVSKRAESRTPRAKRRKKSLAKKVPAKKVKRKIPRKRVSRRASRAVSRSPSRKRKTPTSRKSRVSPKTASRKDIHEEIPAKKVKRKIARRKRTPRKTVSRRASRAVSRSPSLKKKRRTSRKSRVSPKRESRKEIPVKKVKRKIARKKRTPRKTVSRRASRAVSRSPSRKRKTPTTRKSRVSPSKRKTTTRRKPVRVSPKTARKISRKKPPKKEKLASPKTTSTCVKEIRLGFAKLCKGFPQKLPTETSRMIIDCLSIFFNFMVSEMRKRKYEEIGPQEIRTVVQRVLPSHLAELALAHISRCVLAT